MLSTWKHLTQKNHFEHTHTHKLSQAQTNHVAFDVQQQTIEKVYVRRWWLRQMMIMMANDDDRVV